MGRCARKAMTPAFAMCAPRAARRPFDRRVRGVGARTGVASGRSGKSKAEPGDGPSMPDRATAQRGSSRCLAAMTPGSPCARHSGRARSVGARKRGSAHHRVRCRWRRTRGNPPGESEPGGPGARAGLARRRDRPAACGAGGAAPRRRRAERTRGIGRAPGDALRAGASVIMAATACITPSGA